MNLKEFDYKQFLLEKGEKVGVAIAVAVMVLLIGVGLFLPAHGFFSGSPKTNAEELTKLAKTLDQKLDDPNNKPTGPDLPPSNAEKQLIDLDRTTVEGTDYQLAGLFEGHKTEAIKRRLPELKSMDEARVAYAYVPIDGFVFTPDHTQLVMLKPVSGAAAPSQGGGNILGGFGGRGGAGLMGPGQGRGAGAGMGAAGGRGGFRGGLPGQASGLEDHKKQYDLRTVKLQDLNNNSGLTPARQLYPLRMAVIAGTFPLRAQLEEFQKKMHFGSIDEVLAQSVITKDGKAQHAVHFLGVKVQRRTLDPSGKEMEGWRDLDLAAAYKPWLFMTGRRFEPEDPSLEVVTWPGLVMPKLKEFHFSGDGQGDTKGLDSHYPQLEEKLDNIVKTLNALKTDQVAEVTVPPEFKTDDPFDPFHAGPGVEDSAQASQLRPPQGDAGMDPGRSGPGGTPPTGSGPGRSGGIRNKGGRGTPGRGLPGGPSLGRDNAGNKATHSTTPEHCLVRLIDITIEPGQIYQYRLQVRMGNPLQGRTDVANPEWANQEELQTNHWFEVPQTVAVPPELAYYAVDQKELDKPYKGPNAGPLNPTTDTALQIHRWLDAVKIEGMGADEWLIGEWAVADRVIVSRGEYVDRTVRIEMPVWSYAQNRFIIGTDHTNKRANQRGINVDFKNNNLKKYQTILLDFEGGNRLTYKMSLRKDEDTVTESVVNDTSSTDVLLMDPDGNLLGHNSLVDTEDPERIHRREQVQARVERVKNKSAGQPASSGGKPFGR